MEPLTTLITGDNVPVLRLIVSAKHFLCLLARKMTRIQVRSHLLLIEQKFRWLHFITDGHCVGLLPNNVAFTSYFRISILVVDIFNSVFVT